MSCVGWRNEAKSVLIIGEHGRGAADEHSTCAAEILSVKCVRQNCTSLAINYGTANRIADCALNLDEPNRIELRPRLVNHVQRYINIYCLQLEKLK